MSGHVWVDPEGIEKSSGAYFAAAERLRALAETVGRVGSEFDGCWGDDDLGDRFAGSYLIFQNKSADELRRLADRLQAVGDAIKATGRGYANSRDASDEVSTSLLTFFESLDSA
jgi:uncharacterized protein YukE